jgi:hypothetical protein
VAEGGKMDSFVFGLPLRVWPFVLGCAFWFIGLAVPFFFPGNEEKLFPWLIAAAVATFSGCFFIAWKKLNQQVESQDAESDLGGPDGFLDYDPRPYERKLREGYAGWHIRDDALEQIERFLNSDYAGVDLKSDFASLEDCSCVKER